MHVLDAQWLSGVPVQPWKNGGGVTRLLAESEGEWRVSLANVDTNGPYSCFDGMSRLSLIVEGQGVVLRGAGRVIQLPPLVPVVYDGAINWTASLVDAPVVALNIMARAGKFLPSARLVTTEVTLPVGARAVIVAGDTGCIAYGRTGTAVSIQPGQFLAIPTVDEPMQVIGDAGTRGNQPPVVALIEPTDATSHEITLA